MRLRLIVLESGKCILEVPPEASLGDLEAICDAWEAWAESRSDLLILAGVVELRTGISPTGELEIVEAVA